MLHMLVMLGLPGMGVWSRPSLKGHPWFVAPAQSPLCGVGIPLDEELQQRGPEGSASPAGSGHCHCSSPELAFAGGYPVVPLL